MNQCRWIAVLAAAFIGLSTAAYALEPSAEPVEMGIDVSAWQGEVDFSQVRAQGIQTVYIRAGVGASYRDPRMEENYRQAKASGLKVGFYHYMTARTVEEGRQQAQFFARLLAGTRPDCMPAMDFESFGALNRSEINAIARVYLEELERATGKQALVYSDAWNAAHVFDASLASYPLWVAEYGDGAPSTGGAWQSWDAFQYSDQGSIPGIEGHVDLDRFTPAVELENKGVVLHPGGGQTYTVQPGDTLWWIARRFGTSVTWLAEANHIADADRIVPGQVLHLPERGSQSIWYTVRPGDTLWAIARRFGCTVDEIAAINQIPNINWIYPGQRLEVCSEQLVYMVQPGDTLWAIARRYGTTVRQLAAQNHIADPAKIYSGQVLHIKV